MRTESSLRSQYKEVMVEKVPERSSSRAGKRKSLTRNRPPVLKGGRNL